MSEARTVDPESFATPRTGDSKFQTRAPRFSGLQAVKALFVAAAGLSFLFSVYLWFLVERQQGLFVGLWVPSILALGALILSGKGDQR